MTTHRNLAVMETIFTEALIPMSPAQKDAALGLLPFSRTCHVLGHAPSVTYRMFRIPVDIFGLTL